MSEEAAVLTERRGRVMVITLNRPDAMNAINGALSNGLMDAVKELDSDPELTAAVITGNGRGFCAGMDLKAFHRGEDIGPLFDFVKVGSQKPLIGALHGFALAGGCEIALTCDLLVADAGTKIGIREVKVGLFAGAGFEDGNQRECQCHRHHRDHQQFLHDPLPPVTIPTGFLPRW